MNTVKPDDAPNENTSSSGFDDLVGCDGSGVAVPWFDVELGERAVAPVGADDLCVGLELLADGGAGDDEDGVAAEQLGAVGDAGEALPDLGVDGGALVDFVDDRGDGDGVPGGDRLVVGDVVEVHAWLRVGSGPAAGDRGGDDRGEVDGLIEDGDVGEFAAEELTRRTIGPVGDIHRRRPIGVRSP